jgi:hypothetical protein
MKLSSNPAMRTKACLLVLVGTVLAQASIRPSFWLSRSAWEASEVLELIATADPADFRVAAALKGETKPGTVKRLPELAPVAGEHRLLLDLISANGDPFLRRAYESAPPIRTSDRIIVFLGPGDKPTGWTMQTSALWLQDGRAYAFVQTSNPGPSHLVPVLSEKERVEHGVHFPELATEAEVRSNIDRLLRWRDQYDQAVALSDTTARCSQLARLVRSGDGVVIRGALAQLAREGPQAAHAMLPLLEDDSLFWSHFEILDALALTGAGDIRLASILHRERDYWSGACRLRLEGNWSRTFGEAPSMHYLRVVSVLNAIHTLGLNEDLAAVREFKKLFVRCPSLRKQEGLTEIMATFATE